VGEVYKNPQEYPVTIGCLLNYGHRQIYGVPFKGMPKLQSCQWSFLMQFVSEYPNPEDRNATSEESDREEIDPLLRVLASAGSATTLGRRAQQQLAVVKATELKPEEIRLLKRANSEVPGVGTWPIFRDSKSRGNDSSRLNAFVERIALWEPPLKGGSTFTVGRATDVDGFSMRLLLQTRMGNTSCTTSRIYASKFFEAYAPKVSSGIPRALLGLFGGERIDGRRMKFSILIISK